MTRFKHQRFRRPYPARDVLRQRYVGHDGIAEFWHAANEPWQWFEIEPLRTIAHGDCVVAEVQFRGRGAGSGVEVTIEAGHLVRFPPE